MEGGEGREGGHLCLMHDVCQAQAVGAEYAYTASTVCKVCTHTEREREREREGTGESVNEHFLHSQGAGDCTGVLPTCPPEARQHMLTLCLRRSSTPLPSLPLPSLPLHIYRVELARTGSYPRASVRLRTDVMSRSTVSNLTQEGEERERRGYWVCTWFHWQLEGSLRPLAQDSGVERAADA